MFLLGYIAHQRIRSLLLSTPDSSETRSQTSTVALYRMNPNYAAKVKEEIDKLLQVGFVRPVK